MSNKGYQLEVQITDVFRKLFEDALERNKKNKVFRVIGSGRNKLATKTGEDTLLSGDVSIEIDTLPKNLLIECKHYKSKTSQGKSHPIKKEWVDQARDEAENINRLSVVVIKFKGARPGNKELKNYAFKDSNAIHYIIPESHLLQLLSRIENQQNKCIINKEQILKSVSDEELLNEVKKRLRRKICSDELNYGGKEKKQNDLQNNTKNTENS